MKVVVLAGGFGTRLREETEVRPKPMVEIGGRPILWHIMKHYAHHGFREFVIALGYKGDVIKRYFADYYTPLQSGITVSQASGKVEVHDGVRENWIVHLVATGLERDVSLILMLLWPHAEIGGRTLHARVGGRIVSYLPQHHRKRSSGDAFRAQQVHPAR